MFRKRKSNETPPPDPGQKAREWASSVYRTPPPEEFDTPPEAEQEPEEKTPRPRRRGLLTPEHIGGGLKALGLLALVWAAAQAWYFARTNASLFYMGPGGFLGVFSGLAIPDWSFSLRHAPPLQVLGAIAMAGLTTLHGWLLIRALDVRVPWSAGLAFGFMIGAGFSGIVFELLIMAGLLTLPVMWIAWALLIGVPLALVLRRRKRPLLRWWKKPAEDDEARVAALDTPELIDRAGIRPIGPEGEELVATSKLERIAWWPGGLLIALIFAAIFWHAMLFPETYWDSLILYLGYARMTFLEGAFPEKVVAQVGIGLGANYPHMFSNYGAVASTMFAGWSDVYQRFAAPLAGLFSVVLVYHTLRLLWGRRFVAMTGALLLASIPLGIAYSTYASNYSFAILFTAAFLYAAALLARSRLPGAFVLFTFVPAAAMHINFLMGILWVPWVLGVILALKKTRKAYAVLLDEQGDYSVGQFDYIERVPIVDPDAEDVLPDLPADAYAPGPDYVGEVEAGDRPGLLPVITSRWFWIPVIVCMLMGSTWYVRNWVVTGNPVYAFFPEIFTASRNVNPEVLESANIEWFRNGQGIGRVAEEFADHAARRPRRDQYAEDFTREATLIDRLRASWLFWQGYETFRQLGPETFSEGRGRMTDRLAYLFWVTDFPAKNREAFEWALAEQDVALVRTQMAYRMAPVTMGFALPGFFFALLVLLLRRSAWRGGFAPTSDRTANTVLITTLVTGLCLIAYHYLLADLYLYQIIPVIVPFAIIGAIPFVFWRSARSWLESLVELFAIIVVLWLAIVPGLAFALLNFKTPGGAYEAGRRWNPQALDIFRNPGMETETFYSIRFGEDVEMWETVNSVAAGSALLTHDNRHLMYDPSIEIVHLDDWDVQQEVWGAPAAERLQFFRRRGVEYYLHIPNEAAHPVNARAGMQELIDGGFVELVDRFGGNALYAFPWATPAGSATLPPAEDAITE